MKSVSLVRAASLAGAIAVAACLAGNDVRAQDRTDQDTLTVTLNKSAILKLGGTVQTVVVGKAEIADVSMESRNLMVISGKSVGETNLFVLDGEGREMARYNVVVTPEEDRHVTVHRSTDALWTYSCNPRCIVIKNPTDVVGTAFVPPPAAAQPAAAPVTPAPAGAAPAAAPAAAEPAAAPKTSPSPIIR